MAWVKIDDHFDEHPKLAKVGPLGWGYWLAGLSYCNRNLTDGFIPWSKARTLASFDMLGSDGKIHTLSHVSGMSGDDMSADWIIGFLVDAGLWDVVEGGFQVHDYDQYQPTKAQVEAERAKKVAAGQAGGQASAQARAQARSNPVPDPVPVPQNETPTSSRSERPPISPKRNGAQRPDLDGFAEWYQEYPLHKSRPDAEAAWAKLSPDDRAAALAGLRRQIDAEAFSEDKGSNPHPATWLNRRRWEDDPVRHFSRRPPSNGHAPPGPRTFFTKAEEDAERARSGLYREVTT